MTGPLAGRTAIIAGAASGVGRAIAGRFAAAGARLMLADTDDAGLDETAAEIGAGIELPAFTSHITAAAGSFFQLPEVAFGLVPGAGGTVSLPRRIGRQRTAWLALTTRRIDAETALAWGLVDSLE